MTSFECRCSTFPYVTFLSFRYSLIPHTIVIPLLSIAWNSIFIALGYFQCCRDMTADGINVFKPKENTAVCSEYVDFTDIKVYTIKAICLPIVERVLGYGFNAGNGAFIGKFYLIFILIIVPAIMCLGCLGVVAITSFPFAYMNKYHAFQWISCFIASVCICLTTFSLYGIIWVVLVPRKKPSEITNI